MYAKALEIKEIKKQVETKFIELVKINKKEGWKLDYFPYYGGYLIHEGTESFPFEIKRRLPKEMLEFLEEQIKKAI